MAGGWTHASVLRWALAAAALAGLLAGRDALAAGTTTRISLSSTGEQANGLCGYPHLSATGRYVVFDSIATNLTPGDTNGVRDVFVRDLDTGQTTRASVSTTGAQADFEIPSLFGLHRITPDGRFVIFWSHAATLVSGDTNGFGDVFLRDRQMGVTTRESVSTAGVQGNNDSLATAISDDGRFIIFGSDATNLVPNDSNNTTDVFWRDRHLGVTTRISVSSAGAQGNARSAGGDMTPDGAIAAFSSSASNLVPGDTNENEDVFVRVMATGAVSRVSLSSSGAQADRDCYGSWLSADGRFVMFWSSATNLVGGDTNNFKDVFVHDRQTAQTTRVSVGTGGVQANGQCDAHSISRDGRWVGFGSHATNLVPDDFNQHGDAFIHDRLTGQTRLISVTSNGTQGIHESGQPWPSADGSRIAFRSVASNLAPGDTNGTYDVFLHVPSEIPPPTPCPGDANGDRVVDFLDLNIVLGQFGQSGAPGALEGDVNDDGVCDFIDLNIVLGAFGATC